MSSRGLGDLGHQLDELLAPCTATSGLDLVEMAAIHKLKPGRSQPRNIVDDEPLVELAKSIQEHGIIQPIVVSPKCVNGYYEIIAGERRWRAAKLANLQEVPIIIRQFSDSQALAVSLIENIQRENLNILDYIKALHRLTIECDMTHIQVAKFIGKSRVAVTNLMRLLQLDDELLGFLRDTKLDVGHARCLLSLPEAKRRQVAIKIIDSGMSVRDAERLVRSLLQENSAKTKDSTWNSYKEKIEGSLSLPVKMRKGRGKSINLELRCKDAQQLEQIVKLLQDIS